MKKAQKGYSLVETVLVLVIVGLIAFIVWFVFHTKSDTNNSLDVTGSTQVAPPATKSKKVSTNPAASADIIQTETDSKGTKYLADTAGKTLYTYGADTNGVSNCTGSCLTAWPTYKATSTTNLPANVTIITRSDGGTQYAYKGMPLYYYTGDSSAGMVSGDGVNNFSVARP